MTSIPELACSPYHPRHRGSRSEHRSGGFPARRCCSRVAVDTGSPPDSELDPRVRSELGATWHWTMLVHSGGVDRVAHALPERCRRLIGVLESDGPASRKLLHNALDGERSNASSPGPVDEEEAVDDVGRVVQCS